MIPEEDLRSLHQVSVQDLRKRSPGKISVQDLYKRSLGKTLEEISLQQISTEDLCEGPQRDLCWSSLDNIFEQDLCSLYQISVQDLY